VSNGNQDGTANGGAEVHPIRSLFALGDWMLRVENSFRALSQYQSIWLQGVRENGMTLSMGGPCRNRGLSSWAGGSSVSARCRDMSEEFE